MVSTAQYTIVNTNTSFFRILLNEISVPKKMVKAAVISSIEVLVISSVRNIEVGIKNRPVAVIVIMTLVIRSTRSKEQL